MAGPTMYYCDPGIGANSGDGSLGDPWGRASGSVLNYAISQATWDGTNGVQINVKSGAIDYLDAEIGKITSMSTALSRQYTIRGYDTVANDGGIGQISGGGTYDIWDELSFQYINLIDLELFDGGDSTAIRLGNYCLMQRCIVHGMPGTGIYLYGIRSRVLDCHIYDCTTNGLFLAGQGSQAVGNYLANGDSDFTYAIYMSGDDCRVDRNIITVDGGTIGIDSGTIVSPVVINNSILSASGTGRGMEAISWQHGIIANNIAEGFSGAGGIGINLESSTTRRHCIVAKNAVYNCTTAYGNLDLDLTSEQDPGDTIRDNETLDASPFAKTGANTYANRFAYFALNDVGSVREGGRVGV